MIGIGSIVKWVAIAGIVSGLLYAGNRIYEYHLDQIDTAVNTAKVEQALELNEKTRERESVLREVAAQDRARIEAEVAVERNKADKLERMLLIDHDLDRLLQGKPETILRLANKGTVDYFKELEELTQ